MELTSFENNRWSLSEQKIEFRHRIALEIIDSGPVLDIGCGDGLLLDLLKEKGISGIGVDISDVAVRKCQDKDIQCFKHDLSAPLPYSDKAFEYVVMLDFLEHLLSPAEVLREAVRCGRKVVISVPNFSSLPSRIQAISGAIPENNKPKKGHVYWFNYKILMDMLDENRLEIFTLKTNTIK